MSEISIVMAKLAGIQKSVNAVMTENVSRIRGHEKVQYRNSFGPSLVKHYFESASIQIELLRQMLPDLFSDFQKINTEPLLPMITPEPNHYGAAQLEKLIRDIGQVFEIRANSELSQPRQQPLKTVFISHGRSAEWRVVQAFIEKDVGLKSIELAQQANLGQTIIEKLSSNADYCDSAVIVMTGDDLAGDMEVRVRENVMHEIGFFQGRHGRNAVILMHEEGVQIPSNLQGVVYISFPKATIDAGLYALQRELKAIYHL